MFWQSCLKKELQLITEGILQIAVLRDERCETGKVGICGIRSQCEDRGCGPLQYEEQDVALAEHDLAHLRHGRHLMARIRVRLMREPRRSNTDGGVVEAGSARGSHRTNHQKSEIQIAEQPQSQRSVRAQLQRLYRKAEQGERQVRRCPRHKRTRQERAIIAAKRNAKTAGAFDHHEQ